MVEKCKFKIINFPGSFPKGRSFVIFIKFIVIYSNKKSIVLIQTHSTQIEKSNLIISLHARIVLFHSQDSHTQFFVNYHCEVIEACPGFLLSGSDSSFRGANNFYQGRIRPKGLKKIFS